MTTRFTVSTTQVVSDQLMPELERWHPVILTRSTTACAPDVVMSVIKLMSRIVAPSNLDHLPGSSQHATASELHDHTYGTYASKAGVVCGQMSHKLTSVSACRTGITSDPLTQFACAFSALIHDVGKSSCVATAEQLSTFDSLIQSTWTCIFCTDHVGVSNAQLVKEGVPIAAKYNQRSVAEQNSLDLSWNLLMEDRYGDLRNYLFSKQEDLVRFRQLVVNVLSVLSIACMF